MMEQSKEFEEQAKQARYDELARKFDDGTATTEEIQEQTQLYLELYPDEEYIEMMNKNKKEQG